MIARNATLAVLTLLFAGRAVACSCGRLPTASGELRSAEAVFLGRAVKVTDRWSALAKLRFDLQLKMGRRPEFSEKTYCSDVGFQVTFQIERAWKGQSHGKVTLLTGRGGGDCGIRFEEGKRYVVFAYAIGKPVCNVGGCTRTQEADRANVESLDLIKTTRP